MDEAQNLSALGGMVLLIGIVGLLIGLGMSATTTHTSKTCVNSFTGYGQDCVTGSVTTANPMKVPTIGVGILAILGGIGILIVGRDSSSEQISRDSQDTTSDGFANKLREHQTPSDRSADTSKEQNE